MRCDEKSADSGNEIGPRAPKHDCGGVARDKAWIGGNIRLRRSEPALEPRAPGAQTVKTIASEAMRR